MHVVSFGANIDTARTQEDIDTLISNRNNPLKLLFVGVDWLRKGGAKALEVTTILNERGIETELHIVGSSPPIDRLPTYVHLHGFLKKTDPIEAKKITSLFEQSHFLILPSSADCTPIVFSEANSFGVPCISTDVGGITSVIKNNINGYAFDLDASAEKYADYIQEKSKDERVYRSLAQSSFLEYKNRLNWETAGIIMMKIFENLVKK
ncbi:MAG: glycosyltransferase family 4 protein [Ignavibacteria bacterium]|nr:glycosyltransferase family 4 protein [Ignavibacteria bacterium]